MRAWHPARRDQAIETQRAIANQLVDSFCDLCDQPGGESSQQDAIIQDCFHEKVSLFCSSIVEPRNADGTPYTIMNAHSKGNVSSSPESVMCNCCTRSSACWSSSLQCPASLTPSS